MDASDRCTPPYEIMVVIGTRPEIIKAAPLIRSIGDSDSLALSIIHTGQHYDTELSGDFFEVLDIPQPDDILAMDSGTHYEQTSRGIAQVGRVIDERSPSALLAVGDTNTVASTAIATSKMDVLFGHVEAGIRSYDRSMPEETNRIVADHMADVAFAPTPKARENLAAEGITDSVYVTGNTVIDACLEHSEIAVEVSDALDHFNIAEDEYVLATIHRERNVTETERLSEIIDSLEHIDIPVIFPAHPRTNEAIEATGISVEGSVSVVEPLNYLDFLHLLSNARAVVTDSGGIQEEASALETPCITVRPNTERPETIAAGVNILVEPDELSAELNKVVSNDTVAENMTGSPEIYGDGTAAETICSILLDVIENKSVS